MIDNPVSVLHTAIRPSLELADMAGKICEEVMSSQSNSSTGSEKNFGNVLEKMFQVENQKEATEAICYASELHIADH